MQKVISGLVILVAVLGVLTAIGAQIELSTPPTVATTVTDADS